MKMIIGTGIDITELERIEKWCSVKALLLLGF